MATLSQNVAQAISDLGAIKTAIENKGVTVPANTPTSGYSTLIENIPSDETLAKALIARSLTSIEIPQGTTTIGAYAFYNYQTLTSVTIPNSVTTILGNSFYQCKYLQSFVMPDSVTSLGPILSNPGYHFYYCERMTSLTLSNNITFIPQSCISFCDSLTSLTVPESVTAMSNRAIYCCRNLETVNVPGGLTQAQNLFEGCTKLLNVTIGNGFNMNNLNLSVSTRYTAQTIVSWLNALYDRSNTNSNTLRIGATNLDKLTAEEIAIATHKNWNIA